MQQALPEHLTFYLPKYRDANQVQLFATKKRNFLAHIEKMCTEFRSEIANTKVTFESMASAGSIKIAVTGLVDSLELLYDFGVPSHERRNELFLKLTRNLNILLISFRRIFLLFCQDVQISLIQVDQKLMLDDSIGRMQSLFDQVFEQESCKELMVEDVNSMKKELADMMEVLKI